MASKLKVLQVIPSLGYGGAETGCYDLAHFLSEKNCKSYIATSGGKLLKYVRKDRVKVFRIPVHSKNPIIILFNTLIISLIILIYNINIVHVRSRAPGWSCFLATKITSRKLVTTFHGTYNFKSKLKKFYNSVMVRSDLVIAGSNFIFSHINNNYDKHILEKKRKLLVIFRGINTDYFDPKNVSQLKEDQFRKECNLNREDFIILLPGRITPWKGHKIFIEAINQLNQKANERKFIGVILGSDQGRKVYRKQLLGLIEKNRLNNKIKFINALKEMPIVYKIADVVVSSSIEPEAFGRVSVEAQSMYKPIIASNLGGSKETIIDKKTGFLYDSNKPEILADILYDLMKTENKILKSIGSEGRKNVLKKFDVEKMCNSTYTEYKKLLNLN